MWCMQYVYPMHIPAVLVLMLAMVCILQICDTYSSCLYVPACAEDNVVLGSVKFRSRGRLPALSYYYPPKKVCSKLCVST